MRIEFSEEGGVAYFPGLAKPIVIDVDRLDQHAAEELRQLAATACFFDLPGAVGSPAPGAADTRLCTLTIEDGPRKRTVRMREPIENSALQDLVQAVRRQVKSARKANP